MVVEFITSLRDQPKVDFINELIQTHTDAAAVITNINEITETGMYIGTNGIVGTPILSGEVYLRASKGEMQGASFVFYELLDSATLSGIYGLKDVTGSTYWGELMLSSSGSVDMITGYTPTTPLSVATKEFAESLIPTLPTGDGDYKLNIASGVATWVTV